MNFNKKEIRVIRDFAGSFFFLFMKIRKKKKRKTVSNMDMDRWIYKEWCGRRIIIMLNGIQLENTGVATFHISTLFFAFNDKTSGKAITITISVTERFTLQTVTLISLL